MKILGMVILFSISANVFALEFSLPLRCEGTYKDKIEKKVEEHTYLVNQRTDPHWGPVIVLLQTDERGGEEGVVATFAEEFDIKLDRKDRLALKDGYGSWFSHLHPFGMQSTSKLTLKKNGSGKYRYIYWAYDDSSKSNVDIQLRNCHAY